MTKTDKKVRRATRGEYRGLFTKARRIVVAIGPGDNLRFRELRCREEWLLPIDTAFRYAVRLKAFADAAEKRTKKRR